VGANIIQADNLSKKLGNFRLGDISFSLPAGYLCGLIGQNGAGKTTLLHLMLGLYQADEGTLLVDDMDYESREKQIRDMSGTVLTDDLFEPSATVWQNADWYGSFYSRYDRETMAHYLALFGLDGRRKFGRLSKGEKLKCQFAFALSHDARLLLLDEPAGNFDPGFREQFFRIVKSFIRDGTRSVVLATHMTEDLDRMADYIIYLEEGREVFAGDIEELHDRYRMVSGEKYKINLLPKEKIIHMEENSCGAKALVAHSRLNDYDAGLRVYCPAVDELMYFYSKRRKK